MSALDPAFCVRLVVTFAHFLWQAAAVAVAAGLAALLLRRASAQARYAAFVAALLAMVVAPIVTFALLAPGAPAPALSPAPEVEPLATSPLPAAPAPLVVTPAPPRVAPERASAAPAPTTAAPARVDWQRFAPQLSAAYFLGVALMLMRLALALHGGSRLRRAAHPVGDSGVLTALARTARAIGLRFTPAVAFCRNVAVPTVIGVLRPMVLLPMSFATGLSPEQVEAVLAHELAHIRRYDYLVNVLQRVVESALFFHPAVWWVSRRIRIEREHCCDDVVLAAGADPRAYAESLVLLAERSRALRALPRLAQVAALGATDKPSPLRVRILRLLGRAEGEPVRLARAWPVMLLLLGAVVLSVSLVVRTCAEPTAQKPDIAWGEAVEGVRLGLVMTRHEFALNEPVIVRMQLMKADATAKLPENGVNLRNVSLMCRIKGEAFTGGTMYLGPEAPPVKVKDVGVGAVFYSTELDLAKGFYLFVPRINTTYEVWLEYLIGWRGGPQPIVVKSAPVTMHVSVPKDKVVDYYITELLAERPREIARNKGGDNICPYPMDELVKLGRPAVVKLEALLRESDEPGVRERAVGALGYFGAEAELTVPAMREALKDERGGVCRESIIALARIGSAAKDAIPDLVGFLSGGRGMGNWAGKALTAIGPAAVPSLIEAMRRDDESRFQAVLALAEMENLREEARTPLLDLLKDKDDRVRVWAAKALRRMKADENIVVPVFIAALKSADDSARIHAALSLVELGDARPDLIAAVKEALDREKVDYVREHIANALKKLSEVPWGDAVEGVQVRLHADKVQWKAGETPTLKVDARNDGPRTFQVTESQSFYHQVEVDGTWYRLAKPTGGKIVRLGPGDKHEDVGMSLASEWVRALEGETRIEAFSPSAGITIGEGRPGLELPPGKHAVRVAVVVTPVRADTGKPVRAVSNPVEIEILPPVGDDAAKPPVRVDPRDEIVDPRLEAAAFAQFLEKRRWSWQADEKTRPPIRTWQEEWKDTRKYRTSGNLERPKFLGMYQRVIDAKPPRHVELFCRLEMGAAMVIGFEPFMDEEAVPWYAQLVEKFKDLPGDRSLMVARMHLGALLGRNHEGEFFLTRNALYRAVIEVPEEAIVFRNADTLSVDYDPAEIARAQAPDTERLPAEVEATPGVKRMMDEQNAKYRARLLSERQEQVKVLRKSAITQLARTQWQRDLPDIWQARLLALQQERPHDELYHEVLDNYLFEAKHALEQKQRNYRVPEGELPWGIPTEGYQVSLKADKGQWKAGQVPAFRVGVRHREKGEITYKPGEASCELITGGAWWEIREKDPPVHRISLGDAWQDKKTGAAFRLRPGKHIFAVAVVVPIHDQRIRVISNPVEIEILPAETAWGEAVDGIRCGVRPVRPAFTPGEAIAVDVLYRNVSDAPVTVCVWPDGAADWIRLTVAGTAGEAPHYSQHGNLLRRALEAKDFVTLAPGEVASVTEYVPHSGHGNGGPPGSYAVRATVDMNAMREHAYVWDKVVAEHKLTPWMHKIASGEAPIEIVDFPPIRWGETAGGLQVGVAETAPGAPAELLAFLRNVSADGKTEFDGCDFRLELDGKRYLHSQWPLLNGKQFEILAGQILGPIRLSLSDYVAEADREKSWTAPRPLAALGAGTYRARVIQVGRNGNPQIAAPEMVLTIPGDPKAATPWGDAVEGVQVRLVPDKAQWKPGETPRFKVGLLNLGKRQLPLPLAPQSWEVELGGIWHRLSDRHLEVSARIFGLGSEEYTAHLELNKRWDWKIAQGDVPLVLAAGKHTVRLAFIAQPQLDDAGNPIGDPVYVISNPVEIEILAAAAPQALALTAAEEEYYRDLHTQFKRTIKEAIAAGQKDGVATAAQRFNDWSGEALLYAGAWKQSAPDRHELLLSMGFPEPRAMAAIDHDAAERRLGKVFVTRLNDCVQVESNWDKDGKFADDLRIVLLVRLPGEAHPVNGLKCEAAAAQEKWTFGEIPRCRVTLTNVSDRPIDVLGPETGGSGRETGQYVPGAYLTYYDEQGRSLFGTGRSWVARVEAVRIEPGKSWTFEHPPRMPGDRKYVDESSLLPGRYTARLSFSTNDDEVARFTKQGIVFGKDAGALAGTKPEQLWKGTVVAPPVAFEVLDDGSEALRMVRGVRSGEGIRERLKMELTAEKTTLKPGEKTMVMLTCRNVGKERLFMGSSYGLHEKSARADYTEYSGPRGGLLTIEPGQSVEKGGWGFGSGEPTVPGTYALWVEYSLDGATILAKSNVVTIEVTVP